MDLLIMLVWAVAFPCLGLAFLLWMARLEDGLPAAVRKAARAPDPPPVLAIPVRDGVAPLTVPAEPVGAVPATGVALPATTDAAAGRSLSPAAPALLAVATAATAVAAAAEVPAQAPAPALEIDPLIAPSG